MTPRLLLVDDSAHFLEAARRLLEQQGMHVVAVASNSAAAIRQARELQPDVTLLDVDLGGESGFDLAERLQRETGLAPSSVILISTYAREDFADLIATSPAAGFLSKCDLSARAIRELLGGTGDGGHPDRPT
jgi:two-component system, NarL family, nitrate/nitrite response regulator NarL